MTSVLAGKYIVNTRAAHQAPELDSLLKARGAVPVAYPCIDIAPPTDTEALDQGLRDCAVGKFDWMVVTSANTAIALAKQLQALGMPPGNLDIRIAAVGPKTAEAVESHLGRKADLVPDEFVAEALAQSLVEAGGERIFLPQSAIARDVLARDLQAEGRQVTMVEAYRTVAGSGGDDVPKMVRDSGIDAIIFTSSSTVHHFVDRFKAEGGTLLALDGVCLAAIGPVTGAAISHHDLKPTIIPVTYTLAGILDALEDHYKQIEETT